MTDRHKAFIAIIIVSILWGSAGLVAKILVRELHPFVITFYRFGLASVIILPFFLREKRPKYYWRDLVPLSLLQAGNVIFFYLGITTTTANSSSVLNASTPLLTAVLSSVLIHEKIKPTQIIGIVIGFIGVIYIILLPLISSGQSTAGDLKGNLLIAGSILCWVLYTISIRKITSTGKYSPLTTISLNFFVTAFVSGLIAILFRYTFFVPAMTNPAYLSTLFYTAIMVTLVTFSLFQWAIKHLSATTASLKDYIQLVVAVGLNTTYLGEHISLSFVMGSIIVICGVMIATGSRILKKAKEIFLPLTA